MDHCWSRPKREARLVCSHSQQKAFGGSVAKLLFVEHDRCRCRAVKLHHQIQLRTFVKVATTLLPVSKERTTSFFSIGSCVPPPHVAVSVLSISKLTQQWKGADCRPIKRTSAERHRKLIVTSKQSLRVSCDLQTCCYMFLSWALTTS